MRAGANNRIECDLGMATGWSDADCVAGAGDMAEMTRAEHEVMIAHRLTSSASVARLPRPARLRVVRSCTAAILDTCKAPSEGLGAPDLAGSLKFIERCFKLWIGDGDDLERQVRRMASGFAPVAPAAGDPSGSLAETLLKIGREADSDPLNA